MYSCRTVGTTKVTTYGEDCRVRLQGESCLFTSVDRRRDESFSGGASVQGKSRRRWSDPMPRNSPDVHRCTVDVRDPLLFSLQELHYASLFRPRRVPERERVMQVMR